MRSAYLDIETTGLSPRDCELTVVGICVEQGRRHRVVQLVGQEITRAALTDALADVKRIFTYNGQRFDLPFIAVRLGVDLSAAHHHHDLMHDCWRNRLYGGFKAVERKLGIRRRTTGVDGWEAVRLWYRWAEDGDEDALDLLLAYNREDVVNLKKLRQKLGI